MDATLESLLGVHPSPSHSPQLPEFSGKHLDRYSASNNNSRDFDSAARMLHQQHQPQGHRSFEKLDLLSSLSFLANGNGPSGLSPRSDGAEEPTSPSAFSRKRSFEELINGTQPRDGVLKRSRPERQSYLDQNSSATHQQFHQQNQTAVPEFNFAAMTASSSFLNILLAQGMLNKTLASAPSASSLFSTSTGGASRRSSAVSTASAFSCDISDSDGSSYVGIETACGGASPTDGTAKRKSPYRGVIWDKNSRAWRAKLSVKGKLMHVGLFEDEKEAAIAWDKKAIEIRGHKTRLNFPELIPDLYRIELMSRRIRKRS